MSLEPDAGATRTAADASGGRTSDEIQTEIRALLGFLPPFFEPALKTPQILENLWQQTRSAYVNNPVPALFKEQLFAYLSRWCQVPYCVVCHSCALRPLGMTATDVLQLLERPLSREPEVEGDLARLKSVREPLVRWPEAGSPLDRALHTSSVQLFRRTSHADGVRQELHRVLGPTLFAHLVAFLCYVGTCHAWVEAHPHLAYEADARARDQLGPLLHEEPALQSFFATYSDRISREDAREANRLLLEERERRRAAEELARERSRAAAVLRESEERFRDLADNIAQLAWMADHAGQIFWCNRRWFDYTGKALEQTQGCGWQEVHHPEHVERVVAKFRHHIQHGEPWEDTFPLRGKDGQYRWFLSRAQPIRDSFGTLKRWFGTHTDVTAQRRAQETLQQAVSLRDEFLSVASHELRTPLTALTLQLAFFNRLIAGPEADIVTVKRRLESAIRQTTRLSTLVEGLLSISDIASEPWQLDLDTFDVREVVAESAAGVSDAASRAGCELRLQLGDALVGTWDRSFLRRALTHVLSNAIKFGRARPIDVQLVATGESVELKISDRGIGISATDLERIFGRFERAVSANHYGGLGLGLYLAQQAVEAHGGKLEAVSSLGLGSTFIIRLPRVTQSEVG